ncbi:FecR family protein [Polaribacter sejongensis]|uniref:FecR family protein n=1 Tax=Polaribacter sejongensis TaxID=985043 RepID=UPI001AD81A30|nr:FecR family protein [Polaribacter sejongensis]
MNKRIEKIIISYFDNNISETEANELAAWLDEGNRDVFNEYVMLNFSVEQLKSVKNDIITSSWDKIETDINKKKSEKVLPLYLKKISRYAAVIAVLIVSGYLLTQKTNPVINETVSIGEIKATLTLDDGSNIALQNGKGYNNKTIHSNGESLVYETKLNTKHKTKTKETIYNYLTIPRGGLFSIELSDNTIVWLNSESKLKYPVNFKKGKTREVELLYGEAYFDVSKSTKHNGDAFVLKTNNQTITVLGTEFNVKAYRDETDILTTLLEGSVNVKNKNNNKTLIPGQQSKISNSSDFIKVYEVKADDEIAWVNGMFSFKNKPLKEILKVLSRWYDLDVEFTKKESEEILFTGVLRKQQSIYRILESIKTTTNVKYSIKNRILTIK